jgi:predicted PurR-regulated permease PerM
VLAVLTLLLPVAAAEKLGTVLLCLLIALPLARVLWFVQRWVRRGDLRFAAIAAGVLVVVGLGALLA